LLKTPAFDYEILPFSRLSVIFVQKRAIRPNKTFILTADTEFVAHLRKCLHHVTWEIKPFFSCAFKTCYKMCEVSCYKIINALPTTLSTQIISAIKFHKIPLPSTP